MKIEGFIQTLIEKYYDRESRLYDTLLVHSTLVADKALRCIASRGITGIDTDFVKEAALLHDIGIFRCNAPDIYCEGELPYICHGVEGRKILEAEGLPRHALVCERHTGSGLTVEDIIRQGLPLPHRDMTPQTAEERLICYADKFFSKSGNIREEKSTERVIRSMERHGAESVARFMKLHEEFCEEN
jgi:uncharacterized protein